MDSDIPALIIIFVFIVFIVFILCLIVYKINKQNLENMINIEPVKGIIKWKKSPNCKPKIGNVLGDVLKINNIKMVDSVNSKDYILYFPCSYNNIKGEINSTLPNNENQRIFIVNNADQLTSKNLIWKNLVNTFGRNYAKKIMPTTYLLYMKDDIKLLKNEYSPKKIYILKKNIQRQQGLKITNKLDEILNGRTKGYVIAQEMLQNPYLIDKRKINLRMYLLFVCRDNEVSAYVHRNGFMYYTKVPFIKGSLEMDPNVTTGYIDRSVYEINPLTLEDFRKYLDSKKNKSIYEKEILDKFIYTVNSDNKSLSSYVFDNINNLLRDVVIAVKHTICQNSHLKSNITYQLFGADISLSNKLVPNLMEINKGPDMTAKDERDKNVKITVMNDILKIIKVIPDKNNSFIKIYEE